MFLDEATVEFVSGKGGSGAVGFHREKHVPRGGPNGSDGGKGGDVILVADRSKRTLYDFKLQPKFEADSGVHAVGNKRGRDAKSIVVKVPVGTVVTNAETGEPIVDLNLDGMKFAICKGGRGGFGNEHYTSSVRQAPNFAQKGAPGDKIIARLELKLLADVGLVGLPNAGKSTLISQISSARPKIADYPFTTIVPNLGVVRVRDENFVVADMPGLIEGASEGVGLGHQFLRHVERNRVLVHVVDALPVDESDPITNFELIERELSRYSQEIYQRPRLIALNKIDVVPDDLLVILVERFQSLPYPTFPISAATGQGVPVLLDALVEKLRETEAANVEVDADLPALSAETDLHWDVERVEDGWEVIGKRMERMVAMTDLENDEAVRYLHRRLQRIGVIEKLRQMGAEEGDSVFIGDNVFAFTDER